MKNERFKQLKYNKARLAIMGQIKIQLSNLHHQQQALQLK